MKVGDLVIHQDIKSLGVGVIVEFIGGTLDDMYILWSSRDTPTVEMMERLIFIK